MVMVFPLGSSNRSGVLISANIDTAQANIMAIISPKKIPAQMPSVKNPWQSYLDGLNRNN